MLFGGISPLSASIIKSPKQLQSILDKTRIKHDLIGIQVSLYDTNTNESWQFSSGYKRKYATRALNNDHLMQIGSTTKSFIASLILLLQQDAEAGKLDKPFSIEQRLGDWLPEYTDWQDVPIRDLLHMTSGIVNYTEESIVFDDLLKHPHRIWTPIELIHVAYTAKPNTHFAYGTDYEYSNTNYVLLGQVIERVTGQSLEEVIHDRLFQRFPKRFKHTSYTPLAYPRKVKSKMAHGYMMKEDKDPFYNHDMTNMTLSWASSAGAIVSNAQDLSMWPALLFSKQLLNPHSLALLKSRVCVDKHCVKGQPLPQDSQLEGYGLGVGYIHDKRYGDVWTHNGRTLGYHTTFVYLPQKHLSLAVIINEIGPEIKRNDDVFFIAQQILKSLEAVDTSTASKKIHSF